MKKIMACLFTFLVMFPCLSKAGDSESFQIGNNYYSSLEEAISLVDKSESITLLSNVFLSETILIDKTVNINLNGHSISADSTVFKVMGGHLKLFGSGLVKENNPFSGAIVIKGALDENKVNFSILEIDEDITLEGWSGVFIEDTFGKSYGVKVELNGIINAVDDKNGEKGIGVYIDGNIKDKKNSPKVVVNNIATISSTGYGIYQMGYAKTIINGGHIEGKEASIFVKSGVLDIKNGEFISNGESDISNDYISQSGVCLKIESNPLYIGNIEISIKDGIFKSKNSNVFYEYIVGSKNNVINFNISGGTFISSPSKDVFSMSKLFVNKFSPFIAGGKFSSDPSNFLKMEYNFKKNNDNLYEVSKAVSSLVSKEVNSKKKQTFIAYILFFSSILFIIFFSICYNNYRGNYESRDYWKKNKRIKN